MSWVTNRIVPSISSHSSLMRFCIPRRVCTSRAPNGSSIRMICGLTASVRAMATRWRMPPESWPGYFFSDPSSPTFLIQVRAVRSRSSRGTPRSFRPKATFSRTVSQG